MGRISEIGVGVREEIKKKVDAIINHIYQIEVKGHWRKLRFKFIKVTRLLKKEQNGGGGKESKALQVNEILIVYWWVSNMYHQKQINLNLLLLFISTWLDNRYYYADSLLIAYLLP